MPETPYSVIVYLLHLSQSILRRAYCDTTHGSSLFMIALVNHMLFSCDLFFLGNFCNLLRYAVFSPYKSLVLVEGFRHVSSRNCQNSQQQGAFVYQEAGPVLLVHVMLVLYSGSLLVK